MLRIANLVRTKNDSSLSGLLFQILATHGERFGGSLRARYLFLLGDLCHDVEQYARAIEIYSELLGEAQNDMAYNNRALAFWELGDSQAALADFERAVALNPLNAVALYGAIAFRNKHHYLAKF